MRAVVLALALGGCAEDVWNRRTVDCTGARTLEYRATDGRPLGLVTDVAEVGETLDACAAELYGIRKASVDIDGSTLGITDVELSVLEIRDGPTSGLDLDLSWETPGEARWNDRDSHLINLGDFRELSRLFVDASGPGHLRYAGSGAVDLTCSTCRVFTRSAASIDLNVGAPSTFDGLDGEVDDWLPGPTFAQHAIDDSTLEVHRVCLEGAATLSLTAESATNIVVMLLGDTPRRIDIDADPSSRILVGAEHEFRPRDLEDCEELAVGNSSLVCIDEEVSFVGLETPPEGWDSFCP